MEAAEAITLFYEGKDEDSRLVSKHGSVEFLTTVRYVERYLKPGMRILEIGAGTGRYSHYFACKGYPVDAVELVPKNIEVFRTHTLPGERVTVAEGNATELSGFSDGAYDVTLLLGPMYHLFNDRDKAKAMAEAARVTKPGGLLFVAYCMSDPSVVGYGFGGGNVPRLIETGLLHPVTFETKSTPAEVFVLYRREEIDRLAAALPVRRLHLIGTDMYTGYFRGMVDAMDEETFALYLRYHFSICERCDMTGMSHHTLDILRKEEDAASEAEV